MTGCHNKSKESGLLEKEARSNKMWEYKDRHFMSKLRTPIWKGTIVSHRSAWKIIEIYVKNISEDYDKTTLGLKSNI